MPLNPSSAEVRRQLARHEQSLAAMKPTRRIEWMRVFFPYQVLRFISINLRMMRMIAKSHPHPDD